MPTHEEGVKVKWITNSGISGSGVVIEDYGTHALVCVDGEPGEEHHVIYCTWTWLTIVTDGK